MRALVTGASEGIGGAVCRKLAADAIRRGEEAAILLTVRNPRPEVEALAAELRGQGVRAGIAYGDLADPETPGRLVDHALDLCGGLDAVVSNAGMMGVAPLTGLTVEGWDRLFAVNTRATWLLAKAARDALAESRGSLVAVASMSGVQPHAGGGAYSASKAALIMLVRQIAQEWGPQGIRANAVSPGMTRTPLTARIYADAGVAARRDSLVPLGRVARPEDVAGVVGFLAGPDAAHVTGENITVDGGYASSILGHLPGLPERP
ncbi:SDR family NAD(P)-dependent oxidoreductase [Azospirillum agricola]|uniref:SDR family NAD(P)-dependent oxidoreductase n=1 Tax=Azospirillum agricola TaxID=1720247 RepID=UPI000A0F3D33|nr:SDR family oxidoreductase [Azospirillum agricola]SMH39868.1 NAD(P)-dependent dehydrogenase, short-chain alcohol dehydrogenase family [Azospirillum lipoferum]